MMGQRRVAFKQIGRKMTIARGHFAVLARGGSVMKSDQGESRRQLFQGASKPFDFQVSRATGEDRNLMSALAASWSLLVATMPPANRV
jgi:hypothetical protein